MTYADGFVIPAPRHKTTACKKLALWGKKTSLKHGALHYSECIAGDLDVLPGCGTGFKKMAKLERGATR
jgi:uncharacterized protein YbaA (DUF1428 family)